MTEPPADHSFETITTDRTDAGVGEITLDRPERLNSITPTMLSELGEARMAFEEDDQTYALLITGAGDRAFSTGAEITSTLVDCDNAEAEELARQGQETFGRFLDSDLPVLAAISGYCLGGGMELAMACDLRIAAVDATFGLPERDLGIVPGWGGTQRLAPIIGEGRAREMILTGNQYEATTMEDYGFLTEVVEPAELSVRARELAADLAGGPPLAYSVFKETMQAGRDDREAGLAAEAQALAKTVTSTDFERGLEAFDSDENPEFQGE